MSQPPPLNQNAGVPPPTTEQNSSPEYHTYTYALFATGAGERYLHSLLFKVVPYAVWRTWYAIVSYQAPNEDCFVEVSHLTDEREGRVGVQKRKISLDLAAMEERGWLTQTRMQRPFKMKDGSIVLRVVAVKDFAGLYDTAYAYHQWLQSAEYLAPERKNIPLLLADKALTRKLIRFENYRRLLVNAKPGHKAHISGIVKSRKEVV